MLRPYLLEAVEGERSLQTGMIDVREPTPPHRSPGLRALSVLVGLTAFGSSAAHAHDIRLELRELEEGVDSIAETLAVFERRPPVPGRPSNDGEQRRALGEAEVEAALGHPDRALAILLARLEDPDFARLPERIDALLLTSEVLEREGELIGAMAFAREALETGKSPQAMAEAGARWFRLARLTGRLEDRLRLFDIWRSRGGIEASGTEEASQVMYEVAYALRARGDNAEARRLLAKVPSSSAFGSRAAYLAGALFVEDGNLRDAERWFASLADWPIAFEAPAQVGIEKEVRALAALSTARLRYERGDLDAAAEAYAKVPRASPHRREACWELAYLDAERDRHRAALERIHCVKALGAPGSRSVDLKLLESSLLAHLDRYAASLEAYERVHADVVEERELVAASFSNIRDPAEFLFSGMERTATDERGEPTPGPATLLGGAWTRELDRAYSVDRGTGEARASLERLDAEVVDMAEKLAAVDVFEPLELRRRNLERLLREIDHLAGHAGEMEYQVRGRHAGFASAEHDHEGDRAAVRALLDRLAVLRRQVTARVKALGREAERRRAEALAEVQALRVELASLRREAEALRREAEAPVDAAARAALDRVLAKLDDAAMRAEVGVLDTFWLKKQRRTREVERLLREQDEVERQMDEALGRD